MMLERRVVVGRGGRQVLAPPGTHPDLPGAVPAVPPDLVALAEEVARGEVVDGNAARLGDDDPVAADRLSARALRPVGLLLWIRGAWLSRAGLGSIDDDPVAIHPADVQAIRLDQDPGTGLVRG